MEYNGNDHSQNSECPLIYMLKYMKVISCVVKYYSQYSSGFQPFPEVEAFGKFQPMIAVARGTPVHIVAQEN